jgi:Holliday junction resolvase RusA-like endonuclease
MKTVSFIIHGKIQPKQRPRFGRGRTYTPSKTLKSEANIAKEYTSQRGVFLTGPLKVTICNWIAVPKSYSNRKRADALGCLIYPMAVDCDNQIKTILDALNGIAYADDRQVVVLEFKRHYSTTDYTQVTIKELK